MSRYILLSIFIIITGLMFSLMRIMNRKLRRRLREMGVTESEFEAWRSGHHKFEKGITKSEFGYLLFSLGLLLTFLVLFLLKIFSLMVGFLLFLVGFIILGYLRDTVGYERRKSGDQDQGPLSQAESGGKGGGWLARVKIVAVILMITLGGYYLADFLLKQYAVKHVPQEMTAAFFTKTDVRFNTAVWIVFTNDTPEMKISEIKFSRDPDFFFSDVLVKRIGGFLLREEKDQASLPYYIKFYALNNWISSHWTCQQCLNYYVNLGHYSNGVYGLDAAAKAFFNKAPSELDLKEISMLVAVLFKPELYDLKNISAPLTHRAEIIQRKLLKSRNWTWDGAGAGREG